MTRRFVVAAPHSGSGKTTVASLLSLLLRSQGQRVQPFKIGPDYLDPTHLTRAAGHAARTLDSFLLPAERLQALFERASASADIAVIEGVMGLYDGRNPESSEHSTAHLAKLLQAPVVLVIDAGGMSRTVAAIAQGLRDFEAGTLESRDSWQASEAEAPQESRDSRAATQPQQIPESYDSGKLPPLQVAGVILNRVGSERHAQLCKAALEQSGIPCFGFVLRDDALHLPARHLGLVSAEQATWDEQAALHAARHIDLAALLKALPASNKSDVSKHNHSKHSRPTPAPRCRIAYAHDEAFHFYYPDALDELRTQGAELIPFSPLTDRQLPVADGLLLGGGYPEAHVEALSANRSMLLSVQEFAASGRPVIAECGGLMYLARTLEDLEGRQHTLCGVVPYHTRMTPKVLLGYREAHSLADSPLLPAGAQVRGHEFHYSTLTHAPTHPAYQWQAAQQTVSEGYAQGNILASYLHLHYGGFPALARRLVARCVSMRQS